MLLIPFFVHLCRKRERLGWESGRLVRTERAAQTSVCSRQRLAIQNSLSLLCTLCGRDVRAPSHTSYSRF
jgi:hypothetical protein